MDFKRTPKKMADTREGYVEDEAIFDPGDKASSILVLHHLQNLAASVWYEGAT